MSERDGGKRSSAHLSGARLEVCYAWDHIQCKAPQQVNNVRSRSLGWVDLLQCGRKSIAAYSTLKWLDDRLWLQNEAVAQLRDVQ